MKKYILTLLMLLVYAATMATTADADAAARYVASYLREPFHYTSCRWAQKISPKNAVYYNTRQEAIADGHRACKICKP